MSKVFDKEHYENDDNAKHDVISWLESKGFMAWVNHDQFGIDVQGVRKGISYEFEVEVKHNWKGKEFPFNTVHFSNRKRKFALPDNTTWFVMLNHERTHGLMVTGSVFLNAPIVEKNTIYTRKEEFVQISVDKAILITINEEG
jgi:hypothetical protein